ncbi:MAG: ATP-binding cassette domain-containing protein [Bifidobacteriaceae bacterium]|jgi:ABC-2 type transport system ATP-binding protein|nr:ATP-binding cassette domain-containing protein [Bifidobacteriaceae bacterium]
MPPDGLAIEAKGLRKAFGSHEVLKGLDLAVAAGSVFALLGANGAGKTTTVSILTTLLRPDSGTARVAGFDVVAEAAKVRRAITVSGQNVAVDPVLTGLENLVLIAKLRHVGGPRRLAEGLAERFGLADAVRKPASAYSGGMKRRLDIAMSLIGEPAVVFLDEPTTGLDPAGRREVWDAVKQMAAGGVTVMLTTQYMEEAARLADTIALLHDGSIRVAGRHQAVLDAAGGAEDLETAFLILTGQTCAAAEGPA